MRLPLSCQGLIDSAWIEHKSLLPEEGVHMFVARGATEAVFGNVPTLRAARLIK